MHPERDIQSVRLAGALSLGIGVVLLLLTVLAALFALFSGGAADAGRTLQWLIAFLVALVMSSTMMACGAQLQAAKHFGWTDVENIRMVWTALVIVMALGTIASLWFVPPLAYLGGLMLFVLFAIRGAIIRLSRRI